MAGYENEAVRYCVGCLIILAQKEVYQLLFHPAAGLVADRQVDPVAFVHDALIVAERIKTAFPVIGAHAAFSKAPKAHFTGGQMDDHVIDAAAAKAAGRKNPLGSGFLGGKQI